ncbi:hypothetical protein C7475_106326 [Chitinophaga sp. S165]|nr:hypothetical protein C7475_106326 [Chitinophaga sp. S165]
MNRSKQNKLIFELSRVQKVIRFKEVLDEAMLQTYAMDRPLVYRNDLCVKKNQFIHQHKDGRMFLIEQDQNDSKERILKELH